MQNRTSLVALALATSVGLAFSSSTTAQCARVWSPNHGVAGGAGYLPPGGPTNQIEALHVHDPDGSGPAAAVLIVGGRFTTAGGVAANCIASFDAATGAWSPLGTGLGGVASATVSALATLANGDLVAAGNFQTAGGSPAQLIARWDGTAWSPLGNTLFNIPYALATLPTGELVAGSTFLEGPFPPFPPSGVSVLYLAGGTTWTPLGGGIPWPDINRGCRAMTVMPNGDLVVGGFFVNGNVARWNGTAWTFLPGVGLVRALAVLPDGTLVSAGNFGVAAWNGTAWTPLGSGLVSQSSYLTSLAVLPNGHLAAGGSAGQLVEWDGTTWTTIGGGVTLLGSNGIAALAVHDGNLMLGGSLMSIGGTDGFFAQLETTCPATVAVVGVGCSTPNGQATLTAQNLPWVDQTFRALGTNLPNDPTIAVAVTSFAAIPPLALDTVFAQGQPGCDLLVAPDILQAVLANGNTAESSLSLPNTPPLVGIPVHHQMVPLELDAMGAIVAITATNALQLVPGVF